MLCSKHGCSLPCRFSTTRCVQARAAFLRKTKDWDADKLRTDFWAGHHAWAGEQFYSMAIDLRGFYLKASHLVSLLPHSMKHRSLAVSNTPCGLSSASSRFNVRMSTSSPGLTFCTVHADWSILCCQGRIRARANLQEALTVA